MALIKCPECGKDVSEQAEICIHCGFPIKKDQINRDRQNIANKSIGFEYFSEKGDTLALTCKNCKKIWNFSKEHIIDNTDGSGNNYLILGTQLVCPNCSNRMSIGEKIKVPEYVEVNTPPIDDKKSNRTISSTSTVNNSQTSSNNAGGIGIVLLVIAAIFAGYLIFGGGSSNSDNAWVKTGESAFNKLEKGDVYSMTKNEWSYIEKALDWYGD